MGIRVECYSGHRDEEEPRAFHLGERRIEVMTVLDRWLAPDHRYFKVQAYDDSVYILRHDEASGEWEMTLFGQRGIMTAPHPSRPCRYPRASAPDGIALRRSR